MELYDGLELLLKITGALLIISIFYYRLYELSGVGSRTGAMVYDESGNPLLGFAAASLMGSGFSPYTINWHAVILILVDALPPVCLLMLVSPALSLVGELRQDPYGEAVPARCDSVAKRARAVVYACVISMIGSNLLQLFFAGITGAIGGADVHIGLELPLIELVLAMVLLLIADGARRNRALKLDNESII